MSLQKESRRFDSRSGGRVSLARTKISSAAERRSVTHSFYSSHFTSQTNVSEGLVNLSALTLAHSAQEVAKRDVEPIHVVVGSPEPNPCAHLVSVIGQFSACHSSTVCQQSECSGGPDIQFHERPNKPSASLAGTSVTACPPTNSHGVGV